MKHTRVKSTGIVAFAAGVSLALAGCGGNGDSSQADHEVNVGIVQLPIFAPIYVADSKGYFEDEGLEVNLENVKSGQDAIPLAASGELDAVAAGLSSGFFSAIDSDLEVKAVASMGISGPRDEEPASALVVSKDAYDNGEIKDVGDLKGKKLGAPGGEGGTSAYYVSLALEEEGLSATDVEFVNLDNPDIANAIDSGGVDGAFVSAPFWNNAVEDGKAEKIWQMPPETTGTGMLYGEEFAESDDAQAFYDAVARGAQDLQGDDKYSDENLEIIGDATDQTPEEVESVPLYDWFEDLHPVPKQLQQMEKIWSQLGALDYDEPLDPDSYVDTSFAKKVKSQ